MEVGLFRGGDEVKTGADTVIATDERSEQQSGDQCIGARHECACG